MVKGFKLRRCYSRSIFRPQIWLTWSGLYLSISIASIKQLKRCELAQISPDRITTYRTIILGDQNHQTRGLVLLSKSLMEVERLSAPSFTYDTVLGIRCAYRPAESKPSTDWPTWTSFLDKFIFEITCRYFFLFGRAITWIQLASTSESFWKTTFSFVLSVCRFDFLSRM